METWVAPAVILAVFVALYVIASRSPADRDHWIAGMFYLNREDPRLLVPKRHGIGIGRTLNLARPVAWLILAAPFLIAALSAVTRAR